MEGIANVATLTGVPEVEEQLDSWYGKGLREQQVERLAEEGDWGLVVGRAVDRSLFNFFQSGEPVEVLSKETS